MTADVAHCRRFYYGEASSRYRMPDFMIAVNQVCAGIFVEDSNWHRVYICGMKGLDFVEVWLTYPLHVSKL